MAHMNPFVVVVVVVGMIVKCIVDDEDRFMGIPEKSPKIRILYNASRL
jgi:hypothetical protein